MVGSRVRRDANGTCSKQCWRDYGVEAEAARKTHSISPGQLSCHGTK
jgi:hypothetical protein